MQTKISKCPSCNTTYDKSYQYNNIPFCSKRCQLIDLNNWISEPYSFY